MLKIVSLPQVPKNCTMEMLLEGKSSWVQLSVLMFVCTKVMALVLLGEVPCRDG